jgi:L-serine dehydratase
MLSGAREAKLPLWQYVQEASANEAGISTEKSWEMMALRLKAMKEADAGYNPAMRSRSGLVGGDGGKMLDYARSGQSIAGDFVGEVLSAALRMGECNACMHRILAAPTAGACGVLPAVLLPLWRKEHISEENIIEGLYLSAGIGSVLAARASISGAAGGCQAEIGSASAMAAGTLAYLHGGSNSQICHAVAIALKNLLGLICDPVAGLVEVPCVKRNVIGAMSAIAAADMALAGVESRVGVDEVIDAMGEVGRRLPVEFRETALGGLADTPTGRAVKEQMQAQRELEHHV